MARTTFAPRIYVADLASYSNGVLHGVWIDADQDADDIRAEIAAMLRESKHPNVEVTCLECGGGGDGIMAPVGGPITCEKCQTCDGTGKVPSAEEYAIHDSEDWGGIKIGEHEDIDTVAELAEALAEHGEPWAKWWDNESRDGAEVDAFQDAYRGHYKDLEDYAEEYLDGMGAFENANDTLKSYFDYERLARDMELGGDIWTAEASDGGVYVYDNH